jgi:hypothetical protein
MGVGVDKESSILIHLLKDAVGGGGASATPTPFILHPASPNPNPAALQLCDPLNLEYPKNHMQATRSPKPPAINPEP